MKKKNSIKERAKKNPLEVKLYVEIVSYALINKLITPIELYEYYKTM